MQIRALAKASSEFKGMIGDEMETLVEPARMSMVGYSNLTKNQITSNMVNSMDAEVAKTGTQLRFGFLHNVEDYYRYQTITGFEHWRSGKLIAPSLAIAETKQDMMPLMYNAAKRIRRNFMARVRRR